MSVRKAVPVAMRLSWLVLFVLMIAEFVTDLPGPGWATTFLPAMIVLALMVATTTLQARAAAPRGEPRPPVEVEPPVTGRWSALNSPADKVPSHGTHVYGQTYAIDIAADPETLEGEPPARPAFRWIWPLVRRNRAFPAFGAPLLAVADATVVRASDGQRDHLSRTSLAGFLYLMLIEGNVRSIVGAHRVIGNHVILDLGDGTYAVYAHARRGSLRVKAGDTVRAGQRIGSVGNSGNSSEPHLHVHLMDGPDLDDARGVPFSWRGVGVPANGETFTVDAAGGRVAEAGERIDEAGERVAEARPGDVGGAG
ncbi:peptidase M23 [Streptomyces globisporus C-1027]|uniref:Peptidase M23 n=1 Tax=Streptomyces globisporus C-1027 TaxID=1172567 RepID=A0A0U3LRP8_STRGL|nr:M23 family metallopeptidase [Streptomyces globisporus]ALU94761.1 peptidase M23 [Streptomyces globisporus C-1027]